MKNRTANTALIHATSFATIQRKCAVFMRGHVTYKDKEASLIFAFARL